MKKIDELMKHDSTLSKVEANEPIFALRAKDKLAPLTVDFWADIAFHYGVGHEKIKEARRLARAMRAWAEKNGSKIPD